MRKGGAGMGQKGMNFEKKVVKSLHLKYLLYLPKSYIDENKKWPLVLFLHGAGERGNDLEIVKRNGIPKIADKDDSFSFVAVSPQCPEESTWQNHFDALDLLLEEIEKTYSIDKNRIYVTGLSMGGYGTWDFAMRYPDRFAAIIPICGGSTYPELVGVLKDLPIWAFHGAKDDIVPVGESRVLVNILKKYNGNIKYTEYPEAGHDSWTETYNNTKIYEWLLEQKRNNPD